MKAHVKSFTHIPSGRHNTKMEIEFTPGWIARNIFGRATYTRTFIGSGTVWHELGKGRAGTLTEALLADLYTDYLIKDIK